MSENVKKSKILFVEDDSDLTSLYEMRMKMEGLDVSVCSDGETALQEGKRIQPDLILLDLMMPKLDGFAALEQFRQLPETKGAKIIVMSAIGEKQDIDRVMGLGADDYIVKSQITINDVMQRLKTVLGQETEKSVNP